MRILCAVCICTSPVCLTLCCFNLVPEQPIVLSLLVLFRLNCAGSGAEAFVPYIIAVHAKHAPWPWIITMQCVLVILAYMLRLVIADGYNSACLPAHLTGSHSASDKF